MNTNDNYLTPSKLSPIFVAECDYFGFIEDSIYKDYMIEYDDCQSIGRTFALYYKDAVNNLHEWLQNNSYILKEYPKAKFNIYMVDGTSLRGQTTRIKVYTISAAKAINLL